MNFRCRIGLHDWGKWSEPAGRDMIYAGRVRRNLLIQDRRCWDCGIVKSRLKK
jgi:hypothetical protein